MDNLTNIYVGVDVSKKFLDLHIFPIDKSIRIKNDFKYFDKLLQHLDGRKVEQVVCESSGGYEQDFLQFMNQKGYKTWLVDPKRIKAFIISEGVKVKTDKVDAKMIAKFASKTTCKYSQQQRSIYNKKLKEFVRRKIEVTTMIAEEKKRSKGPTTSYSKKLISKHIIFMKKEIEYLNTKIDKLICMDELMREKVEILESMPGIGKTTSSTLVSHLPELGIINSKEVASLVGVAPFNKESGNYKGVSRISGGRPIPRKAIYMAALSASRSNPRLKSFYNKLINNGKKPKVALVAVMRKMIVISNAMIKNNTKWNNEYCLNFN